jgi:hypothetical protein
MKLRLIERALVALTLAQPTVKAIADALRDDPETFLMRAGHDKTFSWVTHASRKFSVLRFDTMGQWLPTYRVINERADVLLTLRWWDRALLSVAWPAHLEPQASIDPNVLLHYAHD